MVKELDELFKDMASAQPGQQLVLDGMGEPAPASTEQNINAGVSTEVNKGTEDGNADVPGTGEITEPTEPAPAPVDTSWDEFITDDVTPEPVKETTSFDWSSVGKAIGYEGEIKGQDDIVNYVKTLREENEKLSTSKLPDTLPKELKEAIEIANNNGDYRSFLEISEIDYSKEDPVALFEDEVADLFYNQDGTFREDEYNEYISNISQPDKLLRGRQIQRELVLIQEQKKNEIRQKAAQEKAENLRRLEQSLQNFEKVGNYTVTPKAKKQMFSDISTGKFMNDLGISPNGNHDWNKLLNQYFKAKYFDAIRQFEAQRAVTDQKRSDLRELTNPSIKGNPVVDNPTQQVKKSAVDIYLESFNLK